jgi:general secretion pathway protein A
MLSLVEQRHLPAARPFGPALDQRFLYPTRSYSRIVDEVRQALRRRDGLITITGDAGAGKTMLCRTLLQEIEEAAFVSVVLDPRASVETLLAHILCDFGVVRENVPAGREQLAAALQRFLRTLIPVNGYALIIVDEAQALSDEVLEQLRLLLNFETDEKKLLQVILVGQPELTARLSAPGLSGLAQRVARRFELETLSRYEVKRYVQRRLATARELAGSWQGTFTPSAMNTVATISRGVPRVINTLCDTALEIGAERQLRVIDAAAVRAAARRLGLHASRTHRWKVAGTAAVLTIATGATLVLGSAISASSSVPHVGKPPAGLLAAAPLQPIAPVESYAALPLAESFNVVVASFRSPERAALVAKQVSGWNLPAFTRVREDEWHQVIVGPYATEAEADVVQRGVSVHGYAGAAVFTEAARPVYGSIDASPGADARMLASRERVSLVLALAKEPAKVVTQPLGPAALMVEAGGVRARVTLPGMQRGEVRVDGRRVYVDFSSPRAARTAGL